MEREPYCFLDHPVTFISNSRPALNLLRDGFSHFIDRRESKRGDSIEIHILSGCRKRLTDYVIGPDGRGHSFTEKMMIFPCLEMVLMKQLYDRLQHLHFLHAAVLSHQNKGFIISGNARCGKTTLALALMEKGFGYLSDEYAVIDPLENNVLAFPKCLYPREETLRFFSSLRSRRKSDKFYLDGKEKRWLIDPGGCFDHAMPSKTKPEFFIFLQPNFGMASRLESIDLVTAFRYVLDASLNLHFQNSKTKEKHLIHLLDIVSRAECYRLLAGRPVESARLMTDLASKKRDRRRAEKTPVHADDVAKAVKSIVLKQKADSLT